MGKYEYFAFPLGVGIKCKQVKVKLCSLWIACKNLVLWKNNYVNKDWWKIKPKGKGLAAVAFTGLDEIFHPEAKNAQEVRAAAKQRAIQLNSEGDPKHIKIKLPKKD